MQGEVLPNSTRTRRPFSHFARRVAVAGALLLSATTAISSARAADEMIKVTDLAGRTVSVKKGVQHAILGEGRLFYATVLLNKDKPFAQLAAIGDDLEKFDPDSWNQYLAKVPETRTAFRRWAPSHRAISVSRKPWR